MAVANGATDYLRDEVDPVLMPIIRSLLKDRPQGANAILRAIAAATLGSTVDLQSVHYEDPATLPFNIPASLDEVDAKWMQDLLRYRGVISQTCEVTSVKKQGVGMTAGYFSAIEKVKCVFSEQTSCQDSFVVKAWPALELLPKDSIKGMFIADMKGYSDFESEDWYPRPNIYLASYDEAKDLWALVMDDCDTYATHCVHENPLTLEQVKKMIPGLVHTAVKFERVGLDKDHPLHAKAAYIPNWVDLTKAVFGPLAPAGAGAYNKMLQSDDLYSCDDKSKFGFPKLRPSKSWAGEVGEDYALEFVKVFEAFWDRSDAQKGATQTVSHGDLRGDNIFWDEKKDTWFAIDFQLTFKGPIASDLAYVMNSGTVLPDVYENHTDEILREFFEQFKAKTVKYKDLTFEKFKDEYYMMSHVFFTYCVSMGAAVFQAAYLDHDAGAGAALAYPNGLGSGAIKYDDLPESEKRKRYYWCGSWNNMRHTIKLAGGVDALKKFARKDIDFKAAFDFEKTPGCPWPRDANGFVPVDVPTAMALSGGTLAESKANEIAEDGKITMDTFCKHVALGWAILNNAL
jgi:hypothetical protein